MQVPRQANFAKSVSVPSRSVKVNLEEGNDQLVMEDSVMANLTVAGLGGNDTVTGTGLNFSAGAVKVNLGEGNDQLNLDATIVSLGAGIKYDGGAGNDAFQLGKAS